jgi:hypothetical protein
MLSFAGALPQWMACLARIFCDASVAARIDYTHGILELQQ